MNPDDYADDPFCMAVENAAALADTALKETGMFSHYRRTDNTRLKYSKIEKDKSGNITQYSFTFNAYCILGICRNNTTDSTASGHSTHDTGGDICGTVRVSNWVGSCPEIEAYNNNMDCRHCQFAAGGHL